MKSFTSLLASRGGEPLSDQTQDMLQDAVFQLISHHQDVDSLLQEATAQRLKDGGCKENQITVSGMESLLEQQSQLTGIAMQTTAATVCASKLQQLLTCHQHEHMLHTVQRKTFEVLLDVIKSVQSKQGFNRNTFVKMINKQCSLPIEVVWMLNTEGIMTYDSFISCNISQAGVIGGFADSIVMLCEKGCEDSLGRRKAIIHGCVSYLINQAYGDRTTEDPASKGLKKVSTALLESIAKKMIDMSTERDINLYEVVLNTESGLSTTTLRKYSLQQITVILSQNPVLKVADALSQQTGWTFGHSPEYITRTYSELMLVFDSGDVLGIVKRVLEQQEVNWQSVLTFIATYLVCFEDATKLLQAMICQTLSVGLEQCELDGVITGFLLARQACLEGQHVFPSYHDWFQNTFGDANHSPANNKKTFSFLFKFLTDIVPFESAQYLRVHLLKPPYVPAKCRPLLTDYITLANTRLSDLKEPIEQLGIFDEGTSNTDKYKALEQMDQDIERSLAAFERNGKVPASLMEASIFRKPYFVGRFLPALLKPRPLPDVPDARMKLIEALHRSDKIPTSLYTNYEKACEKEAAQLLQGVFSDEEDSMEDLLLSPLEQYKASLSHMAALASKAHASKSTKITGITGQMSVISEKLHLVLGTEPGSNNRCKNIEVTLDTPSCHSIQLQIIDEILNIICELCTALMKSDSGSSGSWLYQLISVVLSHSQLVSPFLCRLWSLLVSEVGQLELCHIFGLSGVVLHLASCPSFLSGASFMHAGQEGNFVDILLDKLQCSSRNNCPFLVRFYTSYIQQAFSTFQSFSVHQVMDQRALIPPRLIKQFCYLIPRMYPEVRSRTSGMEMETDLSLICETDATIRQVSVEIYQSQPFKELMDQSQLSLDDWVNMELKIHSHDDFFSTDIQRQEYFDWVLHKWSLGDEEQSYRQTATTLILALLKYDQSRQVPFQSACPDHVQNSCSDSRTYIINLLQRCCGMLMYEQREDTPWLHSTWHQYLTNHSASSQQIHMATVLFFNISGQLPAYLYFCDSPHGPLDQRALQAAVHTTNIYLRNHLCCQAGLDMITTVQLLEGVLGINCLPSGQEMVAEFLHKCPVFEASIIKHWKNIRSWLVRCVIDKTSIVSQLIQRCEQRCDTMSNPEVITAWCQGYRYYTAYTDRTLPGGSLLDILSQESDHFVTESCLTCIMAHLTHTLLMGSSKTDDAGMVKLAQSIICKNKVPLQAMKGRPCPDEMQKILPDHIINFMPVASAKVMIECERITQRSLLKSKPWLVESVLHLHVKCTQLYEKAENESSLPQHCLNYYQALTVEFLTQLSTTLQEILSCATASSLDTLPKDLIEQCDPFIQAMLT